MMFTSVAARSSLHFSRTAAAAAAATSSSSYLPASAAVRSFNSFFPSGTFSDQTKNSSPSSHDHVTTESFSTDSTTSKSDDKSVGRRKIIAEIAEKHDLTLAKSERIVVDVFDTIVEAVSDDKSVQISKFGTFEKYTSSARTGRNPQTGEEIKIPAKQRIRFRPTKHFKDTVQ